jgi:hypothetical protein
MKDANVIEKIRGSVTNNANHLVNNPTWLSIYNSICDTSIHNSIHTSIRVSVGRSIGNPVGSSHSCLIKDNDCEFFK